MRLFGNDRGGGQAQQAPGRDQLVMMGGHEFGQRTELVCITR